MRMEMSPIVYSQGAREAGWRRLTVLAYQRLMCGIGHSKPNRSTHLRLKNVRRFLRSKNEGQKCRSIYPNPFHRFV